MQSVIIKAGVLVIGMPIEPQSTCLANFINYELLSIGPIIYLLFMLQLRVMYVRLGDWYKNKVDFKHRMYH